MFSLLKSARKKCFDKSYAKCADVYFLVFILISFNFLFASVSCTKGETESIPKAGVVAGGDFLSKSIFYHAQMTGITNIIQGELDSLPDLEIGILGQLKIHIVDPISGNIKSEVKFNWPSGVLRPVVIDSDGAEHFKIMSRGPVSDVGLMDNFGNPLWIYKPSGVIINTMDAGDLDRNGILEFYVATHGGLHQLNNLGEKRWAIGGLVHDVEILNQNKDETPLVVSVTFDNHIQFRNYEGKLIREFIPRMKINDIEFVEWAGHMYILTIDSSSFYIMDCEGRIVIKHNLNRPTYAIRGTSVIFSNSQAPYLAIIAKFSSTSGQAMLCIFSAEKELIYKELINTTRGLLAIQSPSSKWDILLVGDGPGKVYKYEEKKR